MANPSAERARRRLLPLVSLALGLTLVAGCRDDGAEVGPETVAPAVDAAIGTLLADRAKAVLMRDQPAFMGSVGGEVVGFRKIQRRLFDNLQELPLSAYDLELHGITQLPDGRAQAEVTTIMQLAKYDAMPVRTPGLLTFRRTPDDVWVLIDDHDEAYDAEHGVDLQPWERTRIEAEDENGVLGIFDRGSIDDAYQIMDAVHDGIEDIAPRIPLEWSHRVVVYALSDVAQMASLDELPGGDPERLEGVAFGVQAGGMTPGLASVRFMLHPRMLGRDDARRDRLIRHELTHVAIAERDDEVPTWLAEGIAEWVSVRAVPAEERVISREAVERAQAGLTGLPPDAGFNGEHSAAHYGIAWWACEVIADRFGAKALWAVLAKMGEAGVTTTAEQDAVLEELLGVSSAELARLAGRRIARLFA